MLLVQNIVSTDSSAESVAESVAEVTMFSHPPSSILFEVSTAGGSVLFSDASENGTTLGEFFFGFVLFCNGFCLITLLSLLI